MIKAQSLTHLPYQLENSCGFNSTHLPILETVFFSFSSFFETHYIQLQYNAVQYGCICMLIEILKSDYPGGC